MARSSKGSDNLIGLLVILFGGIYAAIIVTTKFMYENREKMFWVIVLLILCVFIFLLFRRMIIRQRKKLLDEILVELNLKEEITSLREYDDQVVVKSRQSLDNYSAVKYFKEKDIFNIVRKLSVEKIFLRALTVS